MTGIGDLSRIRRNAFAEVPSGTATRTISHPSRASDRICASVARASRVSVFVMLWTVTGAPPPTAGGPPSLPDVKTGADGTAKVPVKYPDSLTGWKATARAVGSGAQFGIANSTTRTKQPLIVRLQAPRFFVVGDEVVLSAVVNNNTDADLSVKVSLDASGNLALGTDAKTTTLKVPANSEARADWKARVVTPGEVRLKTTAVGGKFSDAMEKTYLSHEHGIERLLTKAGKVRGSDITVKLDLPAARKKDTTTLVVQVAPSLAVTMLDALPYLIDYPYGCTEQTMSRFLPSVVTAKTLKDLGLQPEDVMSRVFGGIEARAGGAAPPNLGAKRDLAKLNEMTDAGLKRLYDFQHGDGGWGWWKEGQSDRWMTAYVVWGLTLAKQSGVALKANVLERGAAFLDKTLVEEELNFDMQAFMLHALAVQRADAKQAGLTAFQTKAFDNLWKNREALTPTPARSSRSPRITSARRRRRRRSSPIWRTA